MTSHNGFRFAELARGESLQSPEVCDCCGRDGLKKTVKLINPDGRVVWFGVGCAARAMGCKPMIVRQGKRQAEERLAAQESEARRLASASEDERFQAWLNERAGLITDWAGRPDRFKQLWELGGPVAARNAYRAETTA